MPRHASRTAVATSLPSSSGNCAEIMIRLTVAVRWKWHNRLASILRNAKEYQMPVATHCIQKLTTLKTLQSFTDP